MRLVISRRTYNNTYLPLFKGGRRGLVPVKRQVRRGGKVFTQTFYVRPTKAQEAPEQKKEGISGAPSEVPSLPSPLEGFVDLIDDLTDEEFSEETIKTWLGKHYDLGTPEKIKDLKDWADNDWVEFILREAIGNNQDYEAQEQIELNIDTIISLAAMGGSLTEGRNFYREDVIEWADNHNIDLETFDFDDLEIPDNYEYGDLVIMAISQNKNPEKLAEQLMVVERNYARTREAEEGNEEIPSEGERREYQDYATSERENLLKRNPFAEEVYLGGGVNATTWVKLENGKPIEGIFKPVSGEVPYLRDNIPGNLHVREAFAWELDKALQLGLVPPTIIRTIGEEVGSIQEFVGGAIASFDGNAKNANFEQKIRASLIDFLLANSDRHNGNYLFDTNRDMRLIDNGLCMPVNNDITGKPFYTSDFYESGAIPQELWDKMKEIDWSSLLNWAIEKGIEPEAVDLFTQRLAWVIDTGTVPDKWEADNAQWENYNPRDPDMVKGSSI